MEQKIRYKARICEDRERIDGFLSEKRVGVLAINDKDFSPYAIPVNYVYLNGSIYFHGMGSGKKNTLLEANPAVCFTVWDELGTVRDSVPCKCDTSYFSVVLFGQALAVDEVSEKTMALSALMDKFMPGMFKNPLSPVMVEKYRSSHDNRGVAVYRIKPEALTAKENPLDPPNMFSV